MNATEPRWRKSSRSANGGDTCVEVADNLPGRILVRDTNGGTLTFTPSSWADFVDLAKRH
jgi:hypothetical protein